MSRWLTASSAADIRIVVALGGGALLQRGDKPDAGIQPVHLRAAAHALAPIATEHDLLIFHGNGPQVGMPGLEGATDPTLTRPNPVDDLAPKTQGCRRFVAATGHPATTGLLTDADARRAGTAGTTITAAKHPLATSFPERHPITARTSV